MTGRAGFTLLEMLVVLTIVACVAAAVPFVGHSLVDRVRLTFAVRTVAARIYRAEARALSVGAPVGLTRDDLGRGIAASVHVWRSARETEVPHLWFYPDRSASPALIDLQAGSLQRTLTIEALDGGIFAAN